MSFKYCATLRATKIVSMVDCELDLNAILTDNSAGSGPALLFVYLFYHQPFVTSVTKTSKAGLLLFLSLGCSLGISKSETDPQHVHSCPKSVLKKAGGREAKLRRKKKTKMEIEFWGASY